MTAPSAHGASWLATVVDRWYAALVDSGFVPMGPSEAKRLLQVWATDLAGLTERQPAQLAVARAIGAGLVEAHLTNPMAVEATIRVLAAHLPPGEPTTAVQAAIASGYADALRAVTLAQQESLTQAVFEARNVAARALRHSQARFRALFLKAAVGIGISDQHGRIVEVNQALADMLGYPPEELVGMAVPDLAHHTDPPEMWTLYDRMARGETDHVRLEKAYHRKTGGTVWTDLTVSLIRDDAGAPQFNVAMMVDVTTRHELERQLRHQAVHDPLTGLPNRRLVAEMLSSAIEGAAPEDRIGVCYLDLDGFKRVNDTLGHEVGDELLRTVAERLQRCAGERGMVAARMGGDEFLILASRLSTVDDLVEMGESALADVSRPVALGSHRIRVAASIGLVDWPAFRAQATDLLKAADVMLYRAKAQGGGRYARYDPDEVAEWVARFELSAALPDALEKGEFALVYQPIVDLPDVTWRGMEALVRWRHPQLGVLSPGRFIDLAEETGVIVSLGRHVMQEACRATARWRKRFVGSDLFVSVNLAAAQSREPSLVDDVLGVLDATGLEPSALQLELTESAIMTTSGPPLAALHTLAASGIRIAIDDFGTGYSNLAYLSNLPVHVLKLPCQLIDGLRDPAGSGRIQERIVDGLIRMAHTIGVSVTAEGVETAVQLDRLNAMGCDSIQGRYVSPPRSPRQFTTLLSRHIPARTSPPP